MMNRKQKSLWRFGIVYLKMIHKKQLAFNLSDWASGEGTCVYDTNYCGTTACALGHFALHPRFQEVGLRLKREGTIFKSFNEVVA